MIRAFRDLPSIRRRWALAAAAFIGLLICMTPDSNPDLPMHRLLGRVIAAQRAVPRSEFLSWTRAGRPWTDYEWGSELVFHAVDQMGGSVGLWALKVAGFASLMLPFIYLLRLSGLPEEWIALALFPYMLSFLPFLNVRPEIFSFLFAPTQLCLLEAARRRRIGHAAAGVAQFLLYALWVNLHPGFPMGLLLCACYAGGAWIDRRDAAFFIALGGVAVLGTFLNPYGPAIYKTFLLHGREAAVLRSHVTEWQLPNPVNVYQAPYWVLLFFSASILFVHRLLGRRAPAGHQAVIVVFALASLTAYRQTAYLSLLAFPLALALAYPMRDLSIAIPYRFELLVLFFGLLANAGVVVLRMEGWLQGIQGRYNARAACEFLKREKAPLATLRMFNSWYWGSYIEYALYPDYHVFMDGRFGGVFTDLLPAVDAAVASPENWRAFLDERGIDLVIMDRRTAPFHGVGRKPGAARPIDIYYMPRETWALVYWDGHAWIWVRRKAVSADWLTRREYRWIHPSDAAQLRIDSSHGRVPFEGVREEVSRYVREIRDPGESATWSAEALRMRRRIRQLKASGREARSGARTPRRPAAIGISP